MSRADVSRRVRDQESRARKREEGDRERLDRLEALVNAQHEKLDRLEDVVYRVIHRDRVGHAQSPKYEETRNTTMQHTENEPSPMNGGKQDISTKQYPISSI